MMTNTFRDEIIYWINDHCEGNETGLYGVTEAADDIIKAIERKIDIVLEEQSKYHEDYAEGLHSLQRLLK